MLKNIISKHKLTAIALMLVCGATTLNAQTTKRVEPKWWFGISGAANLNNYRGTTQVLNNNVSTPTAFHKGMSIKPYASLLTEYRPNKTWGLMLNVAFDNRGGKFDEVIAPCNCPANLTTSLSYVTVEPSLRVAPFANAFYIFAGPTIATNLSKEFTYTQDKQTDVRADFSDIRKTVFGAQAGLGVDIPVSKKTSETQMTVSPFASFQTDLWQSPRTTGNWSIYTFRAGVALKFGTGKKSMMANTPGNTMATDKDVQFSVRAPKMLPTNRTVKETFPLRNTVFFNMGETTIPTRYVTLNQSQAASFKEEQLQQNQPSNLTNGRSARQMAVYYNVLNIVGYRLRANQSSTIILTGASDKNPVEGKQLAENVKTYLVNTFTIDGSRITTVGRDKPVIPSEQPGATNELALLREGDRRVDITSNSPELLMQLGGKSSAFFKPVYISALLDDPLDSHVVFTNEGATDALKSWTIDVIDEKGNVQHFGPYKTDRASVSGKTILGKNTQGNYKVIMNGQTKSGAAISKESSVSLTQMNVVKQDGLRYSILFDFDKATTIAAYENFLANEVTPLIPENGTVIIHGHTDIIGDETYNLNLSYNRAMGTQKIIESALAKAGKKNVTFETYGFGEDTSLSPFDNNYPEERFYIRTVIIDIITTK